MSLDDLARQEVVFWRNKPTAKGWFLSYQFGMAAKAIGQSGVDGSWSCDFRGRYRNRANVPVVVLSDSDDLLMRRCRPWN